MVFMLILVAMTSVHPVSIFAQSATPGSLFGEEAESPCATGRLRLSNLDGADATIAAGVERATEKARAWQPDARLYTLRLGCPLLTAGIQWEGIFFSQTAQAFFATDSGRVDAVNDDPDTIPELQLDGISLTTVYRTLIRAGFTDELLLSAAGGVTIRLSTETHPFGPEAAPRGQIYAHVAIEVSGQVTDVWVSMADGDGTIYRY